ncbi:hypothetical protein CGRA01v4_02223 [Colletotrichum graminicola]|nr:hypothetical protein CGRA01v4_02223 [Colletotrichum graminicola]
MCKWAGTALSTVSLTVFRMLVVVQGQTRRQIDFLLRYNQLHGEQSPMPRTGRSVHQLMRCYLWWRHLPRRRGVHCLVPHLVLLVSELDVSARRGYGSSRCCRLKLGSCGNRLVLSCRSPTWGGESKEEPVRDPII